MIKAWGLNERAQLAAGYHGPIEGPVDCVALPPNTVQAAGAYLGYTGAVLPNGTMRMLGGGVNGEMGQGGHRGSYYLPVIPQISEIKAFACAGAHITALRKDGTVASWGGNSWGTLGNGTSAEGQEGMGSAYPIIVPGLSGVKQVAAGNGTIAALLTNGTVMTWGAGSTGALGIGKKLPLKTQEGTRPQLVPGLEGVQALSVGGYQASNHVLALLEDGTVMQWGAHGACGTKEDLLSPTSVGIGNIVAVAAGPGQSFALDAKGDLYGWGSNNEEQLFLPSVKTQAVPARVASGIMAVSAGFQFSLALTTQGEVIGVGRNDHGQLLGVGLQGISYIYAGEHHAFATGGEPCPPPIRSRKVGLGVEVSWTSPDTTHKWEVTASVLGSKGSQQLLEPSTRSVTVPAVAGQTMAVKVRGGAAWPSRTAVVVA